MVTARSEHRSGLESNTGPPRSNFALGSFSDAALGGQEGTPRCLADELNDASLTSPHSEQVITILAVGCTERGTQRNIQDTDQLNVSKLLNTLRLRKLVILPITRRFSARELNVYDVIRGPAKHSHPRSA